LLLFVVRKIINGIGFMIAAGYLILNGYVDVNQVPLAFVVYVDVPHIVAADGAGHDAHHRWDNASGMGYSVLLL
jgi:hypothetical protein